MRVLGIESSSLVASVALVTDDILTAEYTVDFKKTHSQTLLPMLDEIVKLLELDMDTIDAIAVAGGPGSFTGLRIGAATAKGLGLALKKPLVHVPTVDAMAYNMWGAEGLICPIMDAKRSQVYTGLYHTRDALEVVMEQQPMDMRELAGLLNKKGERTIFLGDGVPVYKDIIREMLTVPHAFAPAQILDAKGCPGARVVTAAQFTPDYLRKPQAERQREAEQSALGAAAKLPGDY